MIDVRLVNSEPPTPSSTPESSDADDDEDDGESGDGVTEIRYVGHLFIWKQSLSFFIVAMYPKEDSQAFQMLLNIGCPTNFFKKTVDENIYSYLGHMPIPRNSHSSKPMVTFIEKLQGLFGMAVWSKKLQSTTFFTGFTAVKKPQFYYIWLLLGVFCSHWWKSRALWLFCSNGHSHRIGNKISMNGMKMCFDECDFPWNGFTTFIYTSQWLVAISGHFGRSGVFE